MSHRRESWNEEREYSVKEDSLRWVKSRWRGPNSGARGEWHWGEGRWEERNQKKKTGWGSRKSQVRWTLWLRGWLQMSTEGFPSCCLQLADHTQRGWRKEGEDKDLISLSFPLNPLFSLPVCLRLSLKGLRLTCWPIPLHPHTGRALAAFISASSTLLPSIPPSLPSSHVPVIPLHRQCNLVFACLAR